MRKIHGFVQMIRNMGVRYLVFRANHELKRRTGLLKRSFPISPKQEVSIHLSEWRKSKRPFFFSNRIITSIAESEMKQLRNEAELILQGRIKFFNSTTIDLGKNYDWVTNPVTGYKYNINQHWTEIADFSPSHGDIKYVWEKSRFSYLYTLIRDEHFNKQSHAAFIFDEIESWIDQNPVNCGPNYRCSQEISLRVLNWIFAMYYHCDSKVLTEERWKKIINAIYWQVHHVYQNINFSRIAVRNNHAITETLCLYVVGTLFPWFTNAALWKKRGKSWFEQEVEYQIYKDGTFLQFSMNYHRVVVQLLTWAFRIAESNNDLFKNIVYERAYKSVNFLFQCQEPSDGSLPNYGSNDGALFFPLNSSDYTDFRPQLDALHLFLCGRSLYSFDKVWNEDSFWFGVNAFLRFPRFAPLIKQIGCVSFTTGGYYLIRDKQTFTFIRCGNHNDRPLQADNLHMDVWIDGVNVLHDAGSYKYNADEETVRYFMGSASHNTVMLDDHDQMKKGPRFIWYYWTQCLAAKLTEDADSYSFSGTIGAFHFLNKNIKHTRKVEKLKNSLTWVIKDEIEGKPVAAKLVQRWHCSHHSSLLIAPNDLNVGREEGIGYYSRYYGVKETCKEVLLTTTDKKVQTTIISG